jgi:hypothetical protein
MGCDTRAAASVATSSSTDGRPRRGSLPLAGAASSAASTVSERPILVVAFSSARGHERVAVPVPADPAAEPQERGCLRRHRPGQLTHEGAVQRPVHARGQPEERLVEDSDSGTYLVQRLHRLAAQRRGAPQQVDFLTEPAQRLSPVGGAQLSVIKRIELPADPAQRLGNRAPPSLSGVRGEHRMHLEPGHQLGARAFSHRRTEGGHRGGKGFPHRLGAGISLAQCPDPLVLLGQVGQVKVDREGTRHGRRPGQRPARDERRDLIAGLVALVAGGVAAAGRDHPVAQFLDIVEQARPVALPDGFAENLAKQPDVAPHRRRDVPGVGGAPVGVRGHGPSLGRR